MLIVNGLPIRRNIWRVIGGSPLRRKKRHVPPSGWPWSKPFQTGRACPVRLTPREASRRRDEAFQSAVLGIGDEICLAALATICSEESASQRLSTWQLDIACVPATHCHRPAFTVATMWSRVACWLPK